MSSSGTLPGEFQVGDIVGGTYMIVDYLGRGAMGSLYHVRHVMLNTEYALKMLTGDKVTELDWKRFQIEAQATAAMNHPNVVSIYNSGLHNRNVPFYVMDLLRGVDLGRKVRADGPLGTREAAATFIEVCSGISYAHKKGIIHRDIKPGNIFLLEKPDPTGARVKVVDFGIAKLSVSKSQDTQSLTGVGDVVGTPYYMSPEQCMGMRVDTRSDIYSLGCTLFEALTGNLPFRGRNATEIMILHQSEPPPSLEKGSGGKRFAPAVEHIVSTALAKEPAERYQTMEQLAADLAALIGGTRQVTVAPAGTLSAGASVIENIEPPATVEVTGTIYPGKRQLLLLVAPVVAGLVALGIMAYWHFSEEAKKSRQFPLAEAGQKPGVKSPEKPPEGVTVDGTDFERETAQFEKANVTRALAVNKPFSTVGKEGGKEYLCFDFPKDVVIGQLTNSDPYKWEKASGQVKFSKDRGVIFMPGEVVTTVPDCLKRFRQNDIYGIAFGPSADAKQFIAILNIPGLQMLDCRNSRQLADLPVNILKQFHNLKIFYGSSGLSDGNALAQAKCWNGIEELYLPQAKSVSPLLKELQTAKRFGRLGLGPSQLSWQDYKTIASMSQLNYLDIHGNHVSDRDLVILSALQNLVDLNLTNTDIDISVLDTLKQFKKLRNLYVSSKSLSADDFQKIKEALPTVKVRQSA